MDESIAFDWSKYASIRVPLSVMKQLDVFKEKHGYTSRPQAIIAALERAEKSNIVNDMKQMLNEFLEKEGDALVRKSLANLAVQKQ